MSTPDEATGNGSENPADYTTVADSTTARTEQDAILAEWCAELSAALDLNGFEVNINAALGLAGKAAHGIVRPAAPLTTYVVGFAAGKAAAAGEDPEVAYRRAEGIALNLVAAHRTRAG